MKNNIIFSYEVNQLSIRIFPIRLPRYSLIHCPLLSCRYITYRRIEPNIKNFSLGIFYWHWDTPISISSHRSSLQSTIYPALSLSICISLPLSFLTLYKPFFQPCLIVSQFEIPVFCFFFYRYISRHNRNRVNKICRV